MNEKNKKTEPIQMRVEPQFKLLVGKMAASYGLTTSAYIRMLVTRDVEKYKGIVLQPAAEGIIDIVG